MSIRFVMAAFCLAVSVVSAANIRWIDVTDHGADPAGANFSNSAFAAAIQAASKEADGPVVLYLPKGNYRFNATLTFPLWLNVKGDGATSVKLDFTALPDGQVAVQMGGPFVAGYPGEVVNYSGFTVAGSQQPLSPGRFQTGMQIGSQAGQTGSKLALAQISDIDVKNFHFGIRLGDINYINVFKHMFINGNVIGLLKAREASEQDNGENIAFENVAFGGNAMHFFVDPYHGGGYDLRFTGCSFDYAKAVPEATLGGSGVVVFDGCHWETENTGNYNEPLLIRLIKPMSNLMFSNTNFVRKGAAPLNTGTPIQWYPDWVGGSPQDMNVTFNSCDFQNFGTPKIYDAHPSHVATQPIAVVISSPRLTANPGKSVGLSRNIFEMNRAVLRQSGNTATDGLYVERAGEQRGVYLQMGTADNDAFKIRYNSLGALTERMSIDRHGEIKFNGTYKFQNVPTASGTTRFLCIDETTGQIYKKATACN